MALRYPSMIPSGVDAGSIIDMFNSGYDRGRDEKARRDAPDLLAKLYGTGPTTQPAPQTLFGLGEMFSPQIQQGAIQRSPLPASTDPATARVEQAFAAQGQGSAPDNLNSNDIAARFLKTVRDGGVTNPYALAAIASTGKRESGFDPKNAVRTWSDPSQSGQAGTAGGIMSWRNERLQALQQFAQQNGDDPRAPSPETQAKYLLAEDPTLIQKLQSAGSAEEAQQLMNNAWRYAGYDQQGGETAQRMALASQYAQQFGGSPSQQALEGMAVGQSMPMGQGVQMADASGQMMPQGGSLPPMPDRDAMLKLFANPITLPYAIEAARSRQAAMQDQRDPMKRLQYQKAVLELENLRNPKAKPTDDMREYELARQQGYNGTFQDYMIGMKRAGATNVNVGGAEKGFDKALGEGYGKHFLDVQDQARAAQRALNALEVMDQALTDPGFYSGAGGETVQQLKRIGASLGMDADGISSMETFNAMSKQAALDAMGGSLGTGFSNADRDFVVDQVPNLGNTQEGNRQLVEIQRKLNHRKLEIAQIARQYAERNDGRIDPGFDDYLARWAEQNPLFPPKPDNPGSGRGAGGAAGRQRARNPQTGETVEWDGSQWRPVQ